MKKVGVKKTMAKFCAADENYGGMRKNYDDRSIDRTYPRETRKKVVAAAAKLCYSDAHITDLLDGLTEEKTAKFLTMLSDLGPCQPH